MIRLITEFGATRLTFEVSRPGRVIDIVADIPGRGRISVEVKTNLAGEASFVERQVRDDLAVHASTGYGSRFGIAFRIDGNL